MGYYLIIGTDNALPLASNTGWSDVITWTAGLPAGKFMEWRHLVEYGWTQNLADVEQELKDAWKAHSTETAGLDDTLDNLIEMLEDRDEDAVTAAVTNGIEVSGDDAKKEIGARWRDRQTQSAPFA